MPLGEQSSSMLLILEAEEACEKRESISLAVLSDDGG
jgi:hypothetical protein